MKTILVEDDPVVSRVIEHALKSRSHEVDAFDEGEAAWEEFQSKRYELAILDWVLPGVDGLELCRRIRKHAHGRSCYILVVTSKDKPGWWVSGKLSRYDKIPLRNKNETPFKFLWWDRYLEIESERR